MSEYVDPNDLTVKRDADGDVLPVTEDAGSFGKVDVIPMAYGDVQEFFGDGRHANVGEEEMAELFDRFIAKPDLSEAAGGEVTADYINEMYPLAPRDLLMAVLRASGVDAQVEMEGNTQANVTVEGN